jgi:putative nucleotidyltransferase with HDIG domain
MALYVIAVVAGGTAVLVGSLRGLYAEPPNRDFLFLLALTLASSILPIKLPNVSANISVSETFIFVGTLRYGAPVGVPLVFLDALIICFRMARRGTAWQKLVFSLAAPAVSLAAAAATLFYFTNTRPLAWVAVADRPPIWLFFIGVLAFTAVYFLLNTTLIAVAIAIDKQMNVFRVWRQNFSTLGLNYAAGTSIAVLLVYNTADIQWAFLFFVFPLLLVLYLTYRWTTERVQQAERHVKDMTRTFMQTIEALAMAIDAKDQVTHGHIRRVQRYADELARSLGVTDDKTLDAIRAAALLHDTGKLAVPEHILNKPGPLTRGEFDRMKLHATIGADILKSIDFPYPVEPIVRHHHENFDGTGYPAGLSGTQIPVGARILSVVDCYDALTSDRPYRSKMTRVQAEQYLRSMRNSRYDPWVVNGFLEILDRLEVIEAAEAKKALAQPAPGLTRVQLQIIHAARAEDREIIRLKRDLRAASSAQRVVDLLLDRLQPIVPVLTLAMYLPLNDSIDLYCSACAGLGATAIAGTRVPIGERITGWVYVNRQAIVNAEAALELSEAARRSSPVSLSHALVAPMLDAGRCGGVIALFAAEPFSVDHQRLVETAVSLLPRGVLSAAAS